tara:strand:- start:1301 stop:2938 length:1638 start_codon:yes stop_codon:yes gene_type:complete
MSILIVIPARGGSKGIPRKNIRPLNGKPLIYYSIKSSLGVENADVIVSTDDDEIALISELFGATAIKRNSCLSEDHVTIDPVILDAMHKAEKNFNKTYSSIVTIQPTSPLISTLDIQKAIEKYTLSNAQTLISAVKDNHLAWKRDKTSKFVPDYDERLNRQQLPSRYKETGGIVICGRDFLNENQTRIGEDIHIYELPKNKAIDIDNFEDMYVCESVLNRKKIVFNIIGYDGIGLGHVYRSLLLAQELVSFDIIFAIEKRSQKAYEIVKKSNYKIIRTDNKHSFDEIIRINPDVLINDILDTKKEVILELISNNIKVINFEDMGSGAGHANIVINALYPHQKQKRNHYIGERYFCLRDEFIYSNKNESALKKIFISFGGIDESNLTFKTLHHLNSFIEANNYQVDIVAGPGYPFIEDLKSYIHKLKNPSINFTSHTKQISKHMSRAEFAITSGGRTVLELASMEVPTIVICQNERELTHTFASDHNGIINLGLGKNLEKSDLLNAVKNLDLQSMKKKLSNIDLISGKKRVTKLIKDLAKEQENED